MNWLLIVVLIILLGSAWLGYRAGLIKAIFSLVSLIIALVLTVMISPGVNNALKKNEKIHGFIYEKVELMITAEEEDIKTSDQEEFIESLPLPSTIKDTLIENKDKKVSDLKEYIANYITGLIINAIAFISTFIAILIALWVICFALNLISKLPVLNQINKMGGLAIGVVRGIILVWILFVIITMMGGNKLGQDALAMIEGSKLLNFIYEKNIFIGFIKDASKFLM